MTVSHDFSLVESCDDPSTWTPLGDGAVSQNTSRKLEGAAALNIYKTGTSTTRFGASHEFPSPIDMTGQKIIIVYIYVGENARDKIRYVYLRVYDSGGNYYTYRRDENIAFNEWAPIYVQQYGTGIDWSQVSKIEVFFDTWSASQTVDEGDVVIDRILVGTGFWVLYVTDVNPHTLDDIALVDARDNLMLVKRISRYAYYVRGPIYVGNGSDVGALKIDTVGVILDGTQLGVWSYGVITVKANSFLIVNKSVLLHVTRTSYPYGGAGISMATNSILRIYNSSYISTSYSFYGGSFRHNLAVQEFTAQNFMFNTMLWMYVPTVRNLNWSGVFPLLPGASLILDDYSVSNITLDQTFYILSGSEIVPRQTRYITFTNAYLLGGRVRVDGSYSTLINPVNFDPSTATDSITGRYEIDVYFDVDIYAIDRYGNPISGATVKVYGSDNVEQFEGTTDSDGHVSARLKTYHYSYDGTTEVRTNYNPFTVTVEIGGGEIARTRIYVKTRSTFFVTPDNVYTMYTYPAKTLVQLDEPIYLYVDVRKIDGTPIEGLSVYADITKPDLSVVTVTFEQYEPGRYRALFTLTDQVGDYNYKAYTTISGAYVECRNTFSVGRIEAGIDELKALLRRHDAKLDAYKWMG